MAAPGRLKPQERLQINVLPKGGKVEKYGHTFHIWICQELSFSDVLGLFTFDTRT